MFLPIPDAMRNLPPQAGQVSPAALRPPMARPPPMPRVPAPPPIVPVRGRANAQLFQAVSREQAQAAAKRALFAQEQARLLGRQPPQAKLLGRQTPPRFAWYEDPIALGSLLLLLPPVGLAVAWTSKRYSNDARWALTIMTALTLCLGAAVSVVLLLARG